MTATDAWKTQLVKLLTSANRIRAPRGLPCKELHGQSVNFLMQYPIVSDARRCLNYKFMAAEALWILSGHSHVEFLTPYVKKMADYSDGGLILQGAYGPRYLEQLLYAAETLRDDPESRQAVIDLWRPMPRHSKDIPCTLSLQFFLSGSYIETVVTMRSSDVWLGLPYDLFSFTAMTAYLALFMRDRRWCPPDMDLGVMTLNMGSSHLYMTDKLDAESCAAGGPKPKDPLFTLGDFMSAEHFRHRLQEKCANATGSPL